MLSVSVIIPHAGGREILKRCLDSLAASEQVILETIIVHNGPVDDVDRGLLTVLENAHVLRYPCNLGFAAACNRGVEAAANDLVFLLNNDAVVEPDCLEKLAEKMSAEPDIGAAQPKIRSLILPEKFDYSSAAGGELDVYGFPFARGRLFDELETDAGQYDDSRQVFWGAGAALMLRRSLYLQCGGLEERFFAHMEEIDLLWRMQLVGCRVLAISSAVAWHQGATTIRAGSFRKLYLNHRNSLAMLFRNYSFSSLVRYFPARLVLDGILSLYSIFQGDIVRFGAVTRANCWFWTSLPYLIGSRRLIQAQRRQPETVILERFYRRSIVWQHFVRRKKTWQELQPPTPATDRSSPRPV